MSKPEDERFLCSACVSLFCSCASSFAPAPLTLWRALRLSCATWCSASPQVDYNEFLEGMASFRRSGDKALRFCFDIYDKDGVGCINLEQLKSVLSCVTRRQSLHGVSGDVKVNSSEGTV